MAAYHDTLPTLRFHGGPLDGVLGHMNPEQERGITQLRVPGGWYVRDGWSDHFDYCPAPDPHRD